MGFAPILLALCLGGTATTAGFYPPMFPPMYPPFEGGFEGTSGMPFAGAYPSGMHPIYPSGRPTTTPKPQLECSYFCYRVNNEVGHDIGYLSNSDPARCDNNNVVVCSPSNVCPAVNPLYSAPAALKVPLPAKASGSASASGAKPPCPTYICQVGDVHSACSVNLCMMLPA